MTTIYWDTQDPANVGWGYRTEDGHSGGFDMDLVSPMATDAQLIDHYWHDVSEEILDVSEEIVTVDREDCPVSADEAERANAIKRACQDKGE